MWHLNTPGQQHRRALLKWTRTNNWNWKSENLEEKFTLVTTGNLMATTASFQSLWLKCMTTCVYRLMWLDGLEELIQPPREDVYAKILPPSHLGQIISSNKEEVARLPHLGWLCLSYLMTTPQTAFFICSPDNFFCIHSKFKKHKMARFEYSTVMIFFCSVIICVSTFLFSVLLFYPVHYSCCWIRCWSLPHLLGTLAAL